MGVLGRVRSAAKCSAEAALAALRLGGGAVVVRCAGGVAARFQRFAAIARPAAQARYAGGGAGWAWLRARLLGASELSVHARARVAAEGIADVLGPRQMSCAIDDAVCRGDFRAKSLHATRDERREVAVALAAAVRRACLDVITLVVGSLPYRDGLAVAASITCDGHHDALAIRLALPVLSRNGVGSGALLWTSASGLHLVAACASASHDRRAEQRPQCSPQLRRISFLFIGSHMHPSPPAHDGTTTSALGAAAIVVPRGRLRISGSPCTAARQDAKSEAVGSQVRALRANSISSPLSSPQQPTTLRTHA